MKVTITAITAILLIGTIASFVSAEEVTYPLQAELEKCAEIKKAYDRLNCERDVKNKITAKYYKENSNTIEVGPVTYYWPGLGTEGNTFEITSSGQALLNLRMLVENTGSTQNESLFCTSPAVCNYNVSNGDKEYKY